MKSLSVSHSKDPLFSIKGMQLTAWRLGELTSLAFEGPEGNALMPFKAATDFRGLQQLRVLRGIRLPFDCVETLARGLPQLRFLEVAPGGDWGVTAAVFPSLSYLRVAGDNADGFCWASDLASMFPTLCYLVAQFVGNYGMPGGLPDYHVPIGWLDRPAVPAAADE